MSREIDDSVVIARPQSGRGDLLARAMQTIKRISGMPDYTGYQEHMAEHHPGSALLSEREFYDQYVNARYGNGATRCC